LLKVTKLIAESLKGTENTVGGTVPELLELAMPQESSGNQAENSDTLSTILRRPEQIAERR